MRILRLVDDGSFAVEFHPYITVVADASSGQRDRIARAFSEAALGRTTDLQGLIEVHGVVLDLDERALDLLELDDSEVRTSLFAEDLPGTTASGVDRRVRAVEDRLAALEQPNRDRVVALQDAEAALAEAVRAEADARAAVDAAATQTNADETDSDETDSDEAAREADEMPTPEVDAAARAALVARRADLQSERDRRFAALDPGAESALSEAEENLRRVIERPADPDPEPEAVGGDEPELDGEAPAADEQDALLPDPPASSEERAALIEELRTSLSLHRLYDPVPVREALDDVRSVQGSGELVPSTEALSLADRLGDLDRRIAAVGADVVGEASPSDLDAADDRVERARLALAELEREAAAVAGSDDLGALEEAHAEVERARDALDGRFGRARAQKRLDDALAVEDEILERLGLHSYADYLARGGSAGPAAGSLAGLDEARREVEAAEAELAELQSTVDAALAQARLVDERRQARDEARLLLDAPDLPDEAITTELLNIRVPADDGGPIARLAAVLETVGLPVGDLGLTGGELEEMVADWLAEYQHTESRLLRRIEALEAADAPDETPDDPVIDVGGATPVVAEAVTVDTRDDAASPDPVVEAEAEIDIARARVAVHEEAFEALTAIEEALAEVEAELEALDASDATDEIDTTAEAESIDGSAAEDDAAAAAHDGPASAGDASTEAVAALEAAADSVAAAEAVVEAAAAAVESIQDEYEAAVEELAVLRQTVSEIDHEPPPVGEIEWYLLARLAAQRQQSFVGSLPLVIAGALDGVTDDDGLVHLLDRLERMAGAVQIVHLTDDARIIEWAEHLDEERAAVVRPVPARTESG